MLPSLASERKFQFAVESFCTDHGSIGTILAFIPSFTQIDSYSTLSSCENTCVMMTMFNNFQRNITHNTVGHLLSSIEVLRSGMVNVQITDATGGSMPDMGNWSMHIVFWEVDEAQ
jgi:hypothetical protein